MPVHFKGNSEYNVHYKWIESYKSSSFHPTAEQAKPKAGLSSVNLGLNNTLNIQNGDGQVDIASMTNVCMRSSEYKEHYKPIQSFKSASFSPSAEQIARAAGQQSTKLGVPCEPPIQRKKRLDGPMTSLSTNFNQGQESPGSEDFALLGANDKFVENVKYKAKSRGASPPKQQKLVQTRNEKENRQVASKPKPAPVVNTEMYRKPTKEDSKPAARPQTEESPKVATPMAPRGMKGMPPLQLKSELEPPKMSTKGPVKSSVKKSATSMDVNKQESVTKLPLKNKVINNMNESVQTNMDKGIALSAPEAPAEYALKYKAGVAPPRPKRKASEYQKSFDWKVGGKASPLLAAEQIVYNSNPAVAPFKADVIPKKSEYDIQFQNWKLSEVQDKPVQAAGKSSKKRSKVKRSKSAGAALSPDKMAAAGSGPIITSDNKRLTKETPDVEVRRRPPISQGQLRKSRSEYHNNFKAPSNFDYVKGAWRGANPPHIQGPEPADESANAAAPALSNWFAEVIELRRKAQEYRKRAQGTHFSREHAVQLMAQQAQAWDVQSSARSGHSTLSALSLETGSARNGASRRDSARATMASDEQVEEQDLETEAGVSKMAWQDEDEDSVIAPSSSTIEETDGGRVPTPKWQQKRSNRSAARHHLDLTTPAVGGAILTSPPQRTRPRGRRAVSKSQPIALQDVDDDDTAVDEVVKRPIAGQTYAKQVDMSRGQIGPTPTFGMPSRDTHYLRDDEVSCDLPLQTSYVHSPLKKQVNKRVPPPGVNIPGTIKEGFGCTYNQPFTSYNQEGDVDDDVLSVSARSVASSCSLASETLERARKRKDEFWGKPGAAAH